MPPLTWGGEHCQKANSWLSCGEGGREGDLVSKRDEGTIAGACDRVERGTWRERYEGVNEDGKELT